MNAPTIPVPLVDKIAISVGLRMPPNFDRFVHTESYYGREEWSIDLGRSNAALFTQLFQHMFESVTIVGPDQSAGSMALDALIEPSIDAFEFSTPTQSNTEAFAVWIRYRLKVYNRDGEVISDWPVSAYGKSQATTLGKEEALRRAAILAMRDAAALMIMKFDKVTRISQLGEKPNTSNTSVQTSAREEPQDEST
jgi:hypothetical protein